MEHDYVVEVRMTLFYRAESQDEVEQKLTDELEEKYGWVNSCCAIQIDK